MATSTQFRQKCRAFGEFLDRHEKGVTTAPFAMLAAVFGLVILPNLPSTDYRSSDLSSSGQQAAGYRSDPADMIPETAVETAPAKSVQMASLSR